jgi:hypothetical protein
VRRVGLLVVALWVPFAGCGGSAAPSRADWSKRVDGICATLDESVSALKRERPANADELVGVADRLARVLDDGVRRLRAVDRPHGADGAKAKRWLDELERQDKQVIGPALAAVKEAARRQDPAALQRAVERVQRADDTHVKQLARDAGARGCN